MTIVNIIVDFLMQFASFWLKFLYITDLTFIGISISLSALNGAKLLLDMVRSDVAQNEIRQMYSWMIKTTHLEKMKLILRSSLVNWLRMKNNSDAKSFGILHICEHMVVQLSWANSVRFIETYLFLAQQEILIMIQINKKEMLTKGGYLSLFFQTLSSKAFGTSSLWFCCYTQLPSFRSGLPL